MAVRMRLTRVGSKKNPVYRVVVADSRSPRDGKFIEIVGRYNPQHDPSLIEFDEDKVKDWLGKGAQPSEAVEQAAEDQEPEQVRWRSCSSTWRGSSSTSPTRCGSSASTRTTTRRPSPARRAGRSRQGDRPARAHRTRVAHDRACRQRARAASRAARDRRLVAMNAPDTVAVGRVGKSHGLDGSFVVEDASETPARFEVGAELIVDGRAGEDRVAQAGARTPGDPARPPRSARCAARGSARSSWRRPATTSTTSSS